MPGHVASNPSGCSTMSRAKLATSRVPSRVVPPEATSARNGDARATPSASTAASTPNSQAIGSGDSSSPRARARAKTGQRVTPAEATRAQIGVNIWAARLYSASTLGSAR